LLEAEFTHRGVLLARLALRYATHAAEDCFRRAREASPLRVGRDWLSVVHGSLVVIVMRRASF
jgi:hypothetical protein